MCPQVGVWHCLKHGTNRIMRGPTSVVRTDASVKMALFGALRLRLARSQGSWHTAASARLRADSRGQSASATGPCRSATYLPQTRRPLAIGARRQPFAGAQLRRLPRSRPSMLHARKSCRSECRRRRNLDMRGPYAYPVSAVGAGCDRRDLCARAGGSRQPPAGRRHSPLPASRRWVWTNPASLFVQEA